MLNFGPGLSPFTDQQALPIAVPRKSASALQLDWFAEHLRDVRGLSKNTVLGHTRRLSLFLQFPGFDRTPSGLKRLRMERIEAFLQHAARTNNRFSLQHIVATVRAFLRLQHAEGLIPQPLHLQIDTPRVYRLETLPRAWTWEQVQALLQSIDRSDAHGLRDFTIIYMAAAYGLRSSEVVQLTLDGLDWRHATLQIAQTKTHQPLCLPLTDEAGDILQQYLRRGRKATERRELFLRMRAPRRALKPTGIYEILDSRIRRSGLDIRFQGTHALRHAFAVRLLRQDVPMKTIGDTLGHRDAESTGVYLRLAVEDLRATGLPVPGTAKAAALLPPGWHKDMPRVRLHVDHPSAPFQSRWVASLRQYLANKQALGRRYDNEARVLRNWDAFVFQFHRHSTSPDRPMFYGWAKSLAHLTPTVRRNRLRIVRNFLLFCCGLRRGELLRLKVAHIDQTQNLLRVEGAKFHKSRLVPLSGTWTSLVTMPVRRRSGCRLVGRHRSYRWQRETPSSCTSGSGPRSERSGSRTGFG